MQKKAAPFAMRRSVRHLALGSAIAAMYAALSIVNIPISFFQLRPAEALTVLPLFTPAAVPGLFVGCLLANYLTGCLWQDIVFGSLATLLGALLTCLLRKRPLLAVLPPVLTNGAIIPPVLMLAYGVPDGYFFLLASVCVGEILSASLLGYLLYRALKPFFQKKALL